MNGIQKRNDKKAVRFFLGMLLAGASLIVVFVVGAFAFRSATNDMALVTPGEKAMVCLGNNECYRVRKHPRPTV